MLTREKFYSEYDAVAPKIFKNYYNFFDIGSKAIPKDTKSISDLGIGSGNFSNSVKKRLPNVKIYGVDMNEDFLKIAKEKIPDLIVYKKDIFSETLPEVDYVISSFTMHHVDSESRNEKLLRVVNSAKKGFINFDVTLFNGHTIDDVVSEVKSFVVKSFPDKISLSNLEYEIRQNDNPAPLEEDRKFFESLGMKFNVLAKESPYVVYSALWPEKKS